MILAHELCHLLFDKRKATPLSVVSGPWTSPVIERRANAFAAELLLPKAGMLRLLDKPRWPSSNELAEVMGEFGVGETICREHLCNRLRLRRPW